MGIKIGDLGFAKVVQNITDSVLGSPLTMAPEILKETVYDDKVDIWSLGVVYFQMLFGEFPFVGQNYYQILNKIKSVQIDEFFFKRKRNIKISDKSKDLIRRIFVEDPNKRITWDEIDNHILFKDEENMNNLLKSSVLFGSKLNLTKFKKNSKNDNDEVIDQMKSFIKIVNLEKNDAKNENNYKEINEIKEEEADEKQCLEKIEKINLSSKIKSKILKNFEIVKKFEEKILFLIEIDQSEKYPFEFEMKLILTKKIIFKINEIIKITKGEKNSLDLKKYKDFVQITETKLIQEANEERLDIYSLIFNELIEEEKKTGKIKFVKENILKQTNLSFIDNFNQLYLTILFNYFKKLNEKTNLKFKNISEKDILKLLTAVLIDNDEYFDNDLNKYKQQIENCNADEVKKDLELKLNVVQNLLQNIK